MVKKMYTMVLTILMVCLLSFPAWAVPGLINYQGKLTDALGCVSTGTFQMVLYLYDAETEGTLLWSESHDTVEVVDGVFDLRLGSVIPFSEGLFENDNLYLEVEIDGETLSPRQQFTSTAYAVQAGNADMLGGQAPSYYAVASEVQKRVTGSCGAGYSIRTINSDGSVICEPDDVNDAVSNPGGSYSSMSVGYASSAGNASTINGLQLTDSSNRLYFCAYQGILRDNRRYEFKHYWPVNWGQEDCLNSMCTWASDYYNPGAGAAFYAYWPRGGGNRVIVGRRDCP